MRNKINPNLSTIKNPKKYIEIINARGHENIRSTHRSTFAITKDPSLSKRGDCIIAIRSNKGLLDLTDQFKGALLYDDVKLKIIIEANGEKETIIAKGSKLLTFKDPNDFVIRKGDFKCDRTLAIKSNKAAVDFDRKLINKIQNSKTKIKIKLIIERNKF